jgi:LmbE family N-acetylglucosaminyl deacetylase
MNDNALPTRKEFLLAVAGSALLARSAAAQTAPGKLLLVAAHPDDEYAFAAATYRLVREFGWTADQVVITKGESGYRYAAPLAETFYGVSLTPDSEGRARLAEIRKREARNAGRILGVRRHYFLDQRDLGFDTDAASAGTANWDRRHLRAFLSGLLDRERHDAVFTLLPTTETHAHHRAATLLALEAVTGLSGSRPLVFGVEPGDKADPPLTFSGLPDEPLTRTVSDAPALVFDRGASFGYRGSLNYRIVVNWLIAEHKSQGLFQNDYSKHQFEQFWLFESSGEETHPLLSQLGTLFDAAHAHQFAQKGTSK